MKNFEHRPRGNEANDPQKNAKNELEDVGHGRRGSTAPRFMSRFRVMSSIPISMEPPNVIEDQVTYPIVTALLAAPNVKAVRAQTMFGGSYPRMVPTMMILQMQLGRGADPTTAAFWFVMSMALLVGFIATYPMNRLRSVPRLLGSAVVSWPVRMIAPPSTGTRTDQFRVLPQPYG
jgi:hypothetical protein